MIMAIFLILYLMKLDSIAFLKLEIIQKLVIIFLNILLNLVSKMNLGTVYISSRGLKKADKYELEPFDLPDWNYSNDFCSIKDINISELNEKELLFFMSLKNK